MWMEKINELEQEYSKYTRKSNYVKTLEDFLIFINIGIDSLEEQQNDSLTEIKLNCKDQLAARIRNFFLFMFQIEEVAYYTEDNQVIEEIISYVNTYIGYYKQLMEIANEENFLELTRLVDFLSDRYNEQMDYFESRRDALEFKVKGFTFTDNSTEDNSEVVADFFNSKLNEYRSKKAVEKNKKMC